MSSAERADPTASAVGPRPGPRVVQAADRVLGVVDRVVMAVSGSLFATLVLVVVMAVFFRYVLNSSLMWGEELARYLAVWLVFLGLSSAHRRGAHVSVGSLLRYLPFLRVDGSRRVSELLTALICAMVTWTGTEVVRFNIETQQTSPALQIPMFWAYLAIPVGFALMTLQSTVRLFSAEPATVVGDE